MVKPEDVLPLTNSEEELYKKLENKIDNLLVKGKGKCTIGYYGELQISDLTSSGIVWTRLKKEYENNDWIVETIYGDSLGDVSIEIKPKKEKHFL